MIIQCTSCDKRFNVPDSAVTAAGRLVECSSCGNQWTQYPAKKKPTGTKPISRPVKTTLKKKINKTKSPIPYSKEYMQEKWGTSIQSYAVKKGLSKKISKTKKQKSIQTKVRVGFGFFNYIIVFFVLSTFFIGVLSFERGRLTRKFPFLEPYIDHFFESLEIFKILILDFFR